MSKAKLAPKVAPKKGAAPKKNEKSEKGGEKAPKTVAPEVQQRADSLVDYGEVRDVPFAKLRIDDNVRRVRSREDQDELNESMLSGKGQERVTVYEETDGTFPVLSGSRRVLALTAAKFPPEAVISVVLKPRPLTRAKVRVAGLKANVHSPMAWPDMAREVGEITGVIDREGKPTGHANLSKAKAEELGVLTTAAAAAELGMAHVTLNTYQRVSKAPFVDLVQIYEAGGSLAHGDRYAAYANRDRAEALAFYLKNHSWPETIQPQKKRAPPAGRPPKDGSRPDVQASLTGKNKHRPAPAKGTADTTWTDGKAPLAAPSGGAAPEVRPTPPVQSHLSGFAQVSFLDEPPTPAALSAPSALLPGRASNPAEHVPYVRGRVSLEEMADHFGLTLEDVVFFDQIAQHWGQGSIEDWGTFHADAVGHAIDMWKQAESSHE